MTTEFNTTTRTLNKLINIFGEENRPLSHTYLTRRYNINYWSAIAGINFLVSVGVLKEINATTHGRLFELKNDQRRITQKV